MTPDQPRNSINPSALPLGDAARLLARVGAPSITEAMLQNDVVAGAPTNADGTINLVHYTAWVLKEMGRGD